MENQFNQLEQKFGHPKDVAAELGITIRHYRRIKKSNKVSRTIGLLMDKILVPNPNGNGADTDRADN